MGDPSTEYAIDSDAMRNGIRLWLDPVIARLGEIEKSFETGRTKAAQGQTMTPGWVAGQGHGQVRDAASSLFYQVTASLEFLHIDQDQVVNSLGTYRDMMLKHVAWAERTDGEHAQHFSTIADTMGRG